MNDSDFNSSLKSQDYAVMMKNNDNPSISVISDNTIGAKSSSNSAQSKNSSLSGFIKRKLLSRNPTISQKPKLDEKNKKRVSNVQDPYTKRRQEHAPSNSLDSHQ